MKMIIYTKQNIDEDTKRIVNEIGNSSFNSNNRDYVIQCNDKTCICTLLKDSEPIGSAYVDFKYQNVISPLSKHYLHIHTLGIHPDHRGKGYCSKLMKLIIKKFGKYPMYLTVCTNEDNPNTAAIKCYQRNGFKLIDMCHIQHTDGVNTYMVRPASKTSKRTHKKGKGKKGKKKKK